jgi:hypothetical protein
VSTVSAVSVAATAAQTEDETEQVDSFIQMQRAKGTFGTLRTAEQSSAITSPISSAKDRRRSERTSALLVRTHGVCPLHALNPSTAAFTLVSSAPSTLHVALRCPIRLHRALSRSALASAIYGHLPRDHLTHD